MNRFLSKYIFYYPVTLLRGERVARHLRRYEAFQWKPTLDIEAHQTASLQRIASYAYENSALYRRRFDAAAVAPSDIRHVTDLARLPFLTKLDLTEHFAELTTPRARFASRKTTGGSTGQAVTVLKNADALARERAATWRAYRWAGVGIGDAQARFWGIPLRAKNRWIYKAVDFVSNRRRLSAFDINEHELERHYRMLHRFRPTYLYGYVSIILEFAEFLHARGYSLPATVRSIITTSEVLSPTIRQRIEQTCRVPIFNEYGCGEVGSIAHECEQHRLHIMADNLIVEIVDAQGRATREGEIVVTDLFNYAMPLIRYRLGDYATMSDRVCSCGRLLPVIENVHGRAYDMVVDADGNRHHPEILLYIFEDIKDRRGGIKQFQVVQKTPSELEIAIVRAGDYAREAIEAEISTLVRAKVHPAFQLRFIYPDAILRERSGKLRLVKSELPR